MHQWLQITTVNWLKDREVLIEGNVIKLLDSYQCLSKIIILHFQFNFCSKNHILQLVSCDFRHNLYTTKYTKVIQITQFRTNWVGKLILFVNYPFVGKRGKHSRSKSLKITGTWVKPLATISFSKYAALNPRMQQKPFLNRVYKQVS